MLRTKRFGTPEGVRAIVMVLAGVCVLLLTPARASADLRLTPFLGVTTFDEERKTTYGVALGFGGLIGLEFEAARIRLGDFEDIPVVDVNAHATTYMGNFVVRLPTGPVQPYGAVGLGMVRVTGDVDVPILGEVVSAGASDWGWNLGGGLFLFPVPNIGIRGDIRHFRTGSLSWDDLTDIGGIGDLPLPELDFWRATVGVTFKF
jgi:opacity protein-like surface antigen